MSLQFDLSEDHLAIVASIEGLCAGFGDDYWSRCDVEKRFPREYYDAMAAGGWIGVAMPQEYGGAGLGIVEASLILNTVAKSGGALAAASAIHINIFGPHPIVVHGTAEQKKRWLPPLIQGIDQACFGVTEPDAGLDTGRIKTFAARQASGGYIVNGQKIWTSTAQVATKILLLARTTPREDCARGVDGLSLFYTDLDRTACTVKRIDKMGRNSVDSNEVFIEGLRAPEEDRIGEEGKGFRYLLDGLNPERILNAMEAIGIGQDGVRRATRYARDRIVFGRPIGQNQAVQHPLAQSWAELEAAYFLTLRAAWLYDNGRPCGVEANAAKYLAGEAGVNACMRSFMTFGGMGYAREFQIERLLREVMITRTAPVSANMILNYIAERGLDLPKSY